MLKTTTSIINASQITGTLPVASGGTGLTSYTTNGVVYASGSTTLASGSVLTFDGTVVNNTGASPEFRSTVTGGASYTRLLGDGIYAFNTSLYLLAPSGRSIVFYADDSEKMRLASTGIVTMAAYGAGTATFSSSGVISSVSDETWKIKDGVPINPNAMLKKLEPGYWYYNNEKKETFGVDRHLGFYAQNVNAAIGPEAAPEPEEGKPWGYYDRSVLAVVVMSLQKALATIETLTVRVAQLENKP
jgi:hypothetical protein